jgi:hypothetical protein
MIKIVDFLLPIDFADEGPWRSFHMDTQGETLVELINNATITEIDKDGGELNCYGIPDADPNTVEAVFDVLELVLRTSGIAAQVEGEECA